MAKANWLVSDGSVGILQNPPFFDFTTDNLTFSRATDLPGFGIVPLTLVFFLAKEEFTFEMKI